MALKTKLDKVGYEALSDDLKKEYIADGDGYKLDADYEDVTGLKNKNCELLEKLKGLKEFEGLAAADVKAKLPTASACGAGLYGTTARRRLVTLTVVTCQLNAAAPWGCS